jgi:hypothetical protein
MRGDLVRKIGGLLIDLKTLEHERHCACPAFRSVEQLISRPQWRIIYFLLLY